MQSNLNITLPKISCVRHKKATPSISSGCITGTQNLGPVGIGMAELKSALLFGGAIDFKTKMGAKSPA